MNYMLMLITFSEKFHTSFTNVIIIKKKLIISHSTLLKVPLYLFVIKFSTSIIPLNVYFIFKIC